MRLHFEKGLRYHGDGDPSGAQTERRGGAGPVRGLLGGKDPTGRFFRGSQVSSQPSPRPLADRHFVLVRLATIGHTRPDRR